MSIETGVETSMQMYTPAKSTSSSTMVPIGPKKRSERIPMSSALGAHQTAKMMNLPNGARTHGNAAVGQGGATRRRPMSEIVRFYYPRLSSEVPSCSPKVATM